MGNGRTSVNVDLVMRCMENTLRRVVGLVNLRNIIDKQEKRMERVFYPYFNRELLQVLLDRSLDIGKIRGIGCGRLCIETHDEIDCLLVFIGFLS